MIPAAPAAQNSNFEHGKLPREGTSPITKGINKNTAHEIPHSAGTLLKAQSYRRKNKAAFVI